MSRTPGCSPACERLDRQRARVTPGDNQKKWRAATSNPEGQGLQVQLWFCALATSRSARIFSSWKGNPEFCAHNPLSPRTETLPEIHTGLQGISQTLLALPLVGQRKEQSLDVQRMVPSREAGEVGGDLGGRKEHGCVEHSKPTLQEPLKCFPILLSQAASASWGPMPSFLPWWSLCQGRPGAGTLLGGESARTRRSLHSWPLLLQIQQPTRQHLRYDITHRQPCESQGTEVPA